MPQRQRRGLVQHIAAARADIVDTVLYADVAGRGLPIAFEELPARLIDAGRYEICCIPFFAYDVALGDVVRTELSDRGRQILTGIDTPSGHTVFRVWFGSDTDPLTRLAVSEEVPRLGARTESFTENLLAIDAPDADVAHAVAKFLDGEGVEWETGHTA